MTTPQEKGDALEAAVAAIEELILGTSPALREKPVLEKKKIILVGGVRHEIDIYVTIDLASGYKSVFIFECKNWQDAVNKNEIIVFSEKIDASQAARGYFVAKAFTSDAEAQAKKDPRIILLTAIEHDPASVPIPIQCFGRFPKMTSLDVKFSVRGTTGLNVKTVKFDDAHAKYLGQRIDLKQQVEAWSREACDEHLKQFNSQAVPEGVYKGKVETERQFPSDELLVDDQDIEKLTLRVEYEVTVVTSPIVSHFEVKSRGRFFKFAPLTVGADIIQWHLAVSNPN
jgi:restriction endonuclease Mrr